MVCFSDDGISLSSPCLQPLSPAAVPSALLLFAGQYREATEEIKISNLDEFPDPLQKVVLVTVMENRKGIWGVREDSFLTSQRRLPVGAMGKGLPEFPCGGHSLHCCTSSGFGGPGGLCFSSCSSSPCPFWPSFLGAHLWGKQSYYLGSSGGDRRSTKASLETEVSSLFLNLSTPW